MCECAWACTCVSESVQRPGNHVRPCSLSTFTWLWGTAPPVGLELSTHAGLTTAPPCLYLPSTGVTSICTTLSWLLQAGLNPCACKASTLPTERAPWPLDFYFQTYAGGMFSKNSQLTHTYYYLCSYWTSIWLGVIAITFLFCSPFRLSFYLFSRTGTEMYIN